MDVRLPDGTIITGVPEGTTREQLTAKLQANGYAIEGPKTSAQQSDEGGAVSAVNRALRFTSPAGLLASLVTPEGRADIGNAVAGAVRGAGSIGATLMTPVDAAARAVGVQNSVVGRDDRRAKMDQALASLGADESSVPYQGGKIAAEVGGTMGVGPGVAAGLAHVAPAAVRAVPGLVEALRTGGMATGVRAAPGIVPQAANLATRVAGAAGTGYLSGGLVDPSNAGISAVLSGSIPVVSRVAGGAGRVIGNAVSPTMARDNATDRIVRALGPDVQQTVADIQTYFPRGAEDIPASTAAITQNPRLAQLEQGSRVNSAPAWYDFDQRQGRAVFNNVLRATDEAGQLGQRAADRADNWKAAWERASENLKPRLWVQRMTQFGADLETAMRSPDSSNPAVRSVLEAINSEMDRLGPNFGIGNLQQLRANLNGTVQPMSPDVFKSAPRDNPAIISIKQEMDDILNTATGGRWQRVLEGYARDSEALHASKAAQKVRNAFVDPNTGRIEGVALNPDTPKITEAGLGRALDAARMPDGSLALSPEAVNRLEATLGVLRAQNVVQGVKRTATAGGGSDTIPNAIASEAAGRMGAPNMLLQVLGAVRRLGTAQTDNALARLLSNPDELAAMLAQYQRPYAPNRLAVGLSRAVPAIAADQ
jgi:hypothetical protein